MIHFKLTSASFSLLLLSVPVLVFANSNPCSVTCVQEQIALALSTSTAAVSSFTSASWESACPGGAQGLLQGCFINAASAANSAIGANVNTAFPMFNATPTSVDAAVYIKKFPPGYQFTATGTGGTNTAVLFDASTLPSSTRVVCDMYLENGPQPDYRINNDPASTNSNTYVVFFDPTVLLGGSTATHDVLDYTPGVGTATALAIPLYAVCIGLDTTTNAPIALTGFTAS